MVRQIQQVTPESPCIHCCKPDWCYRLGELTVCKRDAEPVPGWNATNKRDADGSRYYAPAQLKKSIRPAQQRSWDYPARDGSQLIQVRREDYGDGRKAKIRPWRWTGEEWLSGYEGHVDRADIPVYQLGEVKSAIALGESVFIAEGEPASDAIRLLGLTATTNIGGALKWRESDSADLAGAKVILCPDRDEPGMAHMERIAQDFPDAQWLYAFSASSVWDNLPKSQGLDVADWIKDYQLTKEDILAAAGPRRQVSTVDLDVDKLKKTPFKKQDWTFMDICQRIKEIQALPDPGEQEWEMQELALKTRRSVGGLYKIYDKARQNQPSDDLTDAIDLLDKTPDKFDWLIAGLLPMATTALLYAEGGTGKTLLANSIIKAIACGQSWNGFPTKQGKVLLMQTDEPAIVTAQNLKIAGFQEQLPRGQLFVSYNWQFTQMQRLRENVLLHKPALIVIDSLTSSNRLAATEEKDVEYGRCLYDLRDIAMESGCSILILHHENKTGGVRGSTAIKANVSEVWHLKRNNILAQTQRLLDIEKSRSGCSGLFQLQLDVDDYTWQHQGDFDPSQAGQDSDHSSPPASLPLKARLLNFLSERPGVPFEPEELASEFGGNRDAIRKTLERLWRSGLIQFEERVKQAGKGTKKYRVYLVPEVVLSSEPSPTQPFGSGQPTNESQESSGLSSAKIEPVLSLEPLLDKGLSAQDKTDQRTDPIFETDAQQTIFPAQSAPASNQSRLVPKPGVAPKVGDAVMTPLGQGIVRMTYPDGQFGVDLEGGRSFTAWAASEITVLGFS